MNDYIFDIEQYPNYHCSVWFNIKTQETIIFEIHSDTTKQELYDYLIFLKQKVRTGIGFNIINYDYPMLHKFIENVQPHHTGDFINKKLKEYNDTLITSQEQYKHRIRKPYFTLIDLYLVHHYNNKAKTQSLKGLQFEMGSDVVMETPIHFNSHVRKKDRTIIKEYCINDVKSTFEFYKISRD